MLSKKNNRITVSGVLAAAALLASSSGSAATVAITEWMYNGDEFIEFTNLTNAAIDFTGWSFSDEARNAGQVSLSAFGLVVPGESVILAEASANTFRNRWGLDTSVKVIGGNTVNLGRNDEINLYNGNQLVDRLDFGDQDFSGTIRTDNASGNPNSLAVLDQDTVAAGWSYSFVGDSFGSYKSTQGYTANPGQFALYTAPVPVPAALPMMLGAVGLFSLTRKKRG